MHSGGGSPDTILYRRSISNDKSARLKAKSGILGRLSVL